MTLDAIVREYISEQRESLHGYDRFLGYAISGLRECHMDFSGTPKRVFIDIDTRNYTAPLPNDMISHVFIGLCENGQVKSLGLNPKMCTPHTYSDCGELQTQVTNGSNGDMVYTSGKSRNNENLGGMYGLGGGQNQNGYYKIDLEKNIIALQNLGSTVTQIVLEYIADPTDPNSDTEIHPYDIETIKAWMYMKDISKKRIPLGEKQLARQVYREERRKSMRRHASFTIDEALQSIRKANKLSPKL